MLREKFVLHLMMICSSQVCFELNLAGANVSLNISSNFFDFLPSPHCREATHAFLRYLLSAHGNWRGKSFVLKNLRQMIPAELRRK